MKKSSVDEVKQTWTWAVALAHEALDVTSSPDGDIGEHCAQ
jgi:hypothetical protein